MSRPISQTSERQQRPWEYAQVSRMTYYKAKRTFIEAKWPDSKPLDARSMIDFAPLLRAMARESNQSLADVLAFKLEMGLDLSKPPSRYITHQQAQALDREKSGRIKSKVGKQKRDGE